MTELLHKAFAAATRLPEAEHDALAQWLLEAMAAEHRWTQAFAASADLLTNLADEALVEHRAGRTKALDSEKL